MDAGTTIIKTTLTAAKDSPVNVFADDTDILSLLIHHMTNSSTDVYNIYITNVKKEQRRECYNVTDTLNALENHVIKYLLFAHAFTGCDTTSAINNFGKTSLFKKLKDSVALTNIGDVFMKNSRRLRKSAMLVLVSLKRCIRHLTNCHKSEKEAMMKSSEQMAPVSAHYCYHHLQELHTTMDLVCTIKLKYGRL